MAARTRNGIEAQLDKAAASCARDGAQLTALRRAVLGLILQSEGPATAYQLLDRLKRTHRNAVPPTIYRALDFLLAQGLIHKVERLNAFIPCTEAAHHAHPAQFLICRDCGAVAEMEDEAVAKALQRAAAREGFQPRSITIEIEGTCAACAREG